MKYKIGDKVKIKTLEDISHSFSINKDCKEVFKELGDNRTVTIAEIQKEDVYIKEYYRVEETDIWSWNEEMAECLVTEKIYTPFTRFDIMEI